MTPKDSKAIIIGISGPSSSGKTTLTRLLQAVFSPHHKHEHEHQHQHQRQDELPGIDQTFIIHEDDFYLPDNQIPYRTTITGKTLQDWDTVDAYNIPLLTSTLAHVRDTGALPKNLRSIEDLNERSESGVSEETIRELRTYVSSRLLSSPGSGGGGGGKKSLALLEGILLFCPPDPHHVLFPLQQVLDGRLFLPAAYGDVKTRREGRSGYVTGGPVQELPLPQRSTSADDNAGTRAGAASESTAEEGSFWVDPPGYVDDVVWPNYALDHSWLLLPEGESKEGRQPVEVLESIGDGATVRTNAGIAIPPAGTRKPMVEVLRWAVDEVLKSWGL